MNNSDPLIILPGQGQERRLYSKVIQSPLAGVSDINFRSLVRRWAPEALLFTEMIKATGVNFKSSKYRIDNIINETGPIGVQIFDILPEAMATAASKAEEEGAFLIDINMGCPVKKIASKGGGSGLLKEPELAQKIVSSVVEAVKIPVTVKTRLGWCENSSDPIGFGMRMQEAGAQMLTLHGRTRDQGFSGKANWSVISKVKEKLSIPVIANGDIKSVSEAFRCIKETNADGLMIGRGSLGAPWLVGQIDAALKGKTPIRTPTPKEKVRIALDHLNSLLKTNGEHGLLIARKHLNWTYQNFQGDTTLKGKLMRAKTANETRSLLLKQLELL